MIQVIYNGVDIYPKVMVDDMELVSNYGELLDSITIRFNDADEMWTKYNPQINDEVEVKIDGFTTGVMMTDLVRARDNIMTIKALPVFTSAKTAVQYKCVENINLAVIANDIAGKYGMRLKVLSNVSFTYKRVEQISTPDIKFLRRRCEIEGCCLKIFDKAMIVYSLDTLRNTAPVKSVKKADMQNPKFDAVNVYDTCTLTYNDAVVTVGSGVNPLLTSDVAFYSGGEGGRFATNLLDNQFKLIGKFEKQLDTALTAGNVISVSDLGMFDGNYLILESTHNPVTDKTEVAVGR